MGRRTAAREGVRLGPGERVVPPLLHDRRARRRARRGSRGLRADAAQGARARARGTGRRAPRRPSRRARRPARLPRAAPRGRRRARLGREDPRAGRAPPRLAGRGHDRLRVRERRDGALRRPGRRGAAHALVRGVDGRDALVRGDRGRGEARARAHRLHAGVRPAPLARGRAAGGSGRRAARLPHVRRALVGPCRGGRPCCARGVAGAAAPHPAPRGARRTTSS